MARFVFRLLSLTLLLSFAFASTLRGLNTNANAEEGKQQLRERVGGCLPGKCPRVTCTPMTMGTVGTCNTVREGGRESKGWREGNNGGL